MLLNRLANDDDEEGTLDDEAGLAVLARILLITLLLGDGESDIGGPVVGFIFNLLAKRELVGDVLLANSI